MLTLFYTTIVLLCSCATAFAQTPENNDLPDKMYRPNYISSCTDNCISTTWLIGLTTLAVSILVAAAMCRCYCRNLKEKTAND